LAVGDDFFNGRLRHFLNPLLRLIPKDAGPGDGRKG